MSQITDTGDAPITYVYFLLTESSDGPSLVVRAPGGAGRFLKADDDADLRVLGRRSGTSDSFVDLATSPLDISWSDSADVEIKAHAGAVSAFEQRAVHVKSTYSP